VGATTCRTSALAPLVTVLIEGPLPLLTGGELRIAEFQHAVVGPDGWLPDVESGGLVALGIVRGQVEVVAVEPAPDLRHEQDVRELLARHYRNEGMVQRRRADGQAHADSRCRRERAGATFVAQRR